MKNREIAERRAVNQIWNAAQDYSLQPMYVAFDEDGDADFYFNTVITITVYRSKDARVLKDCLLLCDDYEKKLSRTLQGSDIYRLNHSGGVPVTVSKDTAYLLGQACKYAELSGGRIDPTVAPLMDLWNFTGQAADKNAQKRYRRLPISRHFFLILIIKISASMEIQSR